MKLISVFTLGALAYSPSALARTMTVYNACPFTIWYVYTSRHVMKAHCVLLVQASCKQPFSVVFGSQAQSTLSVVVHGLECGGWCTKSGDWVDISHLTLQHPKCQDDITVGRLLRFLRSHSIYRTTGRRVVSGCVQSYIFLCRIINNIIIRDAVTATLALTLAPTVASMVGVMAGYSVTPTPVR